MEAVLIDANGSGTWDGALGGDLTIFIAARHASGRVTSIDLEGDGAPFLSKVVDATSRFFGDRNANGIWEGQAGGDTAYQFAHGAGPGTILVRPVPPF